MSRKGLLLAGSEADEGGGSVVDLESGAERDPSQLASSE
jgi:hypothetical protein